MASPAAESLASIDSPSEPELQLPTRADTVLPLSGNEDIPSIVASSLGANSPIEPVAHDTAPYGIATNEEELWASIRKILEDMAQRNARLSQEPPQPSTSSQATSQGGGSAATGPNRVATMRRLPDNIDDALSQFFSYLMHDEQEQPTNDDTPEDNSDSEDEPEGADFRDTRSESGSEAESERFYTAINNSTESFIPSDTKTAHLDDIPESLVNTLWGTPLSRYQPAIQKLYRERVAAGLSPDWPFADFLEFEFVKWMVVNDISQTARDKLIKLPITL